MNGAGARLAHPGDILIIIGYGVADTETESVKPKVVFVDGNNRIADLGHLLDR
ncbi:hypothetical protein GCM10027615_55380 [Plantactinospora veratri]